MLYSLVIYQKIGARVSYAVSFYVFLCDVQKKSMVAHTTPIISSYGAGLSPSRCYDFPKAISPPFYSYGLPVSFQFLCSPPKTSTFFHAIYFNPSYPIKGFLQFADAISMLHPKMQLLFLCSPIVSPQFYYPAINLLWPKGLFIVLPHYFFALPIGLLQIAPCCFCALTFCSGDLLKKLALVSYAITVLFTTILSQPMLSPLSLCSFSLFTGRPIIKFLCFP